MSTETTVRFRRHGAVPIACLIVALSTFSLIEAGGYLALLALVPLGIGLWAWRAGTDAGPDGLRVRAVLGELAIPWTAVSALGPTPGGGAAALLRDGRLVGLTAVRATDLPALIAASGHQLDRDPATPGPGAQ